MHPIIESHQESNKPLFIFGPTGSGKTLVSLAIAEKRKREIISSDSRQVFRYMNIGTDKIDKQTQERIPHHLIDVVDPNESYDAFQWRETCVSLITSHIVVGGTGLYLDLLIKGFDLPKGGEDPRIRTFREEKEKLHPGAAREHLARLDPSFAQSLHPHATRHVIRRIEILESGNQRIKTNGVEGLLVLLLPTKEITNQKVEQRVQQMISRGLIDEVEWLYCTYGMQRAFETIGYREIIRYLDGERSKEFAIERLIIHTRQYAKRQRTWLRRYLSQCPVPYALIPIDSEDSLRNIRN